MKAKIDALIAKSLQRDPATINTDWFGALLISGLLDWQPLGYPQVLPFARDWLRLHIRRHAAMPPEALHGTIEGSRCRVVRGERLLVGTYIGYFGISFACKKLYDRTGDADARQVCLDVGDVILHHTARNALGLINHDDGEHPFTIPDVAFFVVPPLLIAASLDAAQGPALARQARLQLQGFHRLFYDPSTRLTRTLYRDGRLGDTHWIRATGWLLWTIVEALPYLSPDEAAYHEATGALAAIAEGLRPHQDASGGFHVLIDEPDTPPETTGSIMIAGCLHRAVRMGWLDARHLSTAEAAWQFVGTRMDAQGNLHGCHSGWALPAEAKILEFDRPLDWMPGMLLTAGAEFAQAICRL